MTTCACHCHPHTQWGPDGSQEQRDNHPDCDCVCCGGIALGVANGFFASEQEAIAEEAAWAAQVEAEEGIHQGITGDPVAPATEVGLPPTESAGLALVQGSLSVVEGGADPGADEGVEEVDPLDIPDHYDLPMYGSIVACPKCNGDKVRTEYHPHGVLSEPCGTRFGWPNIQNLGEHLCRKCARCKYGWPEECASGA